MKQPTCRRIPGTHFDIGGFFGDYLDGITEQWLLVAPKANPGMLEMFRDRDASPLRDMVPWAGEFAGKYLTGAVQVLRLNKDPKLKAWLKEFVHHLIRLQDKDGYLGPWPRKHKLTNDAPNCWQGRLTWDTWGHYHVMLGLILWDEEVRDKEALACATRIADLFCRKYLGKRKVRLVDTGSTEMNLAPVHVFCLLHRKTKDERYLEFAKQIVDEFGAKSKGEPLAGDYLQQALLGREFYETPKPRWESLHPIMALAELFWITGEDEYQKAFEQIWWSIVKFDRHNNGGFSSGEKATGNPYHLAAIETCCTIAWMAMSVEMLKLTGISIVADEIELSSMNSVPGIHSSTGRWSTYDTPMNGVRRCFTTDHNWQAREGSPELNCCSVNSSRGFGMLSDWGLMRDREGLILNYYGQSVMSAKLGSGPPVTLKQETSYPAEGRILIRVEPQRSSEFALKLRIPYWSEKTRVKVNGEAVRGVKPGNYLKIERKWKSGDLIDLTMDMSLHLWQGEQECKGLASIYRGPILLTYDHRYNLDLAKRGKLQTRDLKEWDPVTCMLDIPTIDLQTQKAKKIAWEDWLPPVVLLEFRAAGGKTVRLCDFGSAGEAGTPYCSWLPVKNCPAVSEFSRENPLRSSRV
jgi:DUF1680 family protein